MGQQRGGSKPVSHGGYVFPGSRARLSRFGWSQPVTTILVSGHKVQCCISLGSCRQFTVGRVREAREATEIREAKEAGGVRDR